jgi:hypothetical protein
MHQRMAHSVMVLGTGGITWLHANGRMCSALQGAEVDPSQRKKGSSSGSRRSSKQHLPLDAMGPAALLHQEVSSATGWQYIATCPGLISLC